MKTKWHNKRKSLCLNLQDLQYILVSISYQYSIYLLIIPWPLSAVYLTIVSYFKKNLTMLMNITQCEVDKGQ